ncbi:non-specific lipid-transfer protein 2-like isoform 1 [Anopheles sinensis]|uniref:Non-specific lipid-transfer protein 2-like isoform 1 n=1 Tax=Anopheles sinensis TaxID=74873 RepID=A0A084WTS3_ANOSI|nr:non-specific lipid-transfer protein 2-like isoform 1 [Anopheles sinensis]
MLLSLPKADPFTPGESGDGCDSRGNGGQLTGLSQEEAEPCSCWCLRDPRHSVSGADPAAAAWALYLCSVAIPFRLSAVSPYPERVIAYASLISVESDNRWLRQSANPRAMFVPSDYLSRPDSRSGSPVDDP